LKGQNLGATSLEELEAAAKEDRIKKAKGLGAALHTKFLENLSIAKSGEGRIHIHRAGSTRPCLTSERPADDARTFFSL
jgi:DNA polymerase (family 10)